jgi:hypothetical protein
LLSQKKAGAEENLSTRISLVSLVRYAARGVGDLEHQANVQSSNPTSRDGQAGFYSASFHRAQAASNRMKKHHTFSSGRSWHHSRAQDVNKVALYLIGDGKS